MVKSFSAGVFCPTFFLACREGLGKRGNIPSGETAYTYALAAQCARVVPYRSPLLHERAQGMPDARCTRGLVCKIVQRSAHEHTGSAEAIRHSLRNGLTAYAALSPATNSSCHRRWRIRL